ncbi:hypothetical protein V2G26_017423 [Clonostachys chloroleuca]
MASGDKAITARQTAELESLANQIQTSIESNQCSPDDWTQKLRNLRNISAGSYKQGETVKEKYREPRRSEGMCGPGIRAERHRREVPRGSDYSVESLARCISECSKANIMLLHKMMLAVVEWSRIPFDCGRSAGVAMPAKPQIKS